MKKETAILVVVVATLVAFAAGRWSTQIGPRSGADDAPASPSEVAAAPSEAASGSGIPAAMPVKGSPDALVTIVEISDFQCPFCSRVGPTVKKLFESYPKDIRVVWANNALPFHDRAKPAATAAMAAHRQGKFWEMHDLLFANQGALTDENFKKWAGELGLDLAKFDVDLKDPEIAKQIDREQKAANAVGARGTPAFFINGKLLSGAQPFDNFKREVDAAIEGAKKHAATKKGLALMEATFPERDPALGTKVVNYFFKGEEPVAAAPERPSADKEAADSGPAKPPADSYEVWNVAVDVKNDSILGDNDKALVTIVEWSDFQCPFCSRGAAAMDEVIKEYGDKVRVVFRHNPLPFHDKAKPASAAAIAAGAQGKFWEMHDKLFANSRDLSDENLGKWAKELGLDIAKFDAVRNDPKTLAIIDADMAAGGEVGVRGTPNFRINGRQLVGAQPVAVFKAIIDEEIAKAEKAGKKGQAWYEEVVGAGKSRTDLNAKVNEIDVTGLPFKGAKDAPVTVVEFSDFQCPFCSRVGEPLAQAMAANKGKVKVVFAHYPLSFHQQAMPAAVATQEALAQGGNDMFWKLHDLLFANQRELSPEKIDALAKEAGVDMAKLEAARKDGKHEAFIKKVIEIGNAIGVRGTPSVYINGRKFEPMSGYTPDAFGEAIAKATKK